MKKLVTTMFLTVAFNFADGQQIIAEHSGFNNPTTEGFLQYSAGNLQIGAITNDLGFDAWGTQISAFADVDYSKTISNLSPSDVDWLLSVTLRVVTTSTPECFYVGINSASGLNFGSDINGNPIVKVGNTYLTLDKGSTYNNYELIYRSSSGTASLWVDGTEELSGITVQSGTPSSVRWGGGYQGNTTYQANWNSMILEIIPEPSPAWLFVLGSGALFYARRKYRR